MGDSGLPGQSGLRGEKGLPGPAGPRVSMLIQFKKLQHIQNKVDSATGVIRNTKLSTLPYTLMLYLIHTLFEYSHFGPPTSESGRLLLLTNFPLRLSSSTTSLCLLAIPQIVQNISSGYEMF